MKKKEIKRIKKIARKMAKYYLNRFGMVDEGEIWLLDKDFKTILIEIIMNYEIKE